MSGCLKSGSQFAILTAAVPHNTYFLQYDFFWRQRIAKQSVNTKSVTEGVPLENPGLSLFMRLEDETSPSRGMPGI